MTLESFLLSQLFAFLMIFTRIGSGIMFMPGVGEGYVSPRIRLLFAVMMSLMLVPVVQNHFPPVPGSPLQLAVLMAGEVLIGTFFGLMSRIIVSTMHTVGMIISNQSSLSAATMFDVSQATQGTTIGNFLSIVTVLLIFVTNLHHLMLQGLVESYAVFQPGQSILTEDMVSLMARVVSDVFALSIKLASPVIAAGLLVNLAAGVLSRLMPNMQVFFVLIPAQIQISFLVLMTAFSGMFLWYLDAIEEKLRFFVGGG